LPTRAPFQPALVNGREITRRRILARRQANEIDRLASFFTRRFRPAVAQEGSGHDIRQHRHAAEGLRDLKGPRKAKRTDLVRPQADDFLTEAETEPVSGR
jgi:hypothetical protein